MKSALTSTDFKNLRLRNIKILSIFFLPFVLYIFYCISGIFKINVDYTSLKQTVMWCLSHPKSVYNDKTLPCVAMGFIIWFVASFQAYSSMNNNLMHGNEYGAAKWGSIFDFNCKYASWKVPVTSGQNVQKSEEMKKNRRNERLLLQLSPYNKVLSENIRMRYDSDTLRNNNIFVVGGSGAGKTSFFLTPNLLSMHGCNIYTDPKGGLIEEFGDFLRSQPDTNVYCINLCEMDKSQHFNLFSYIRTREDLQKLVSNLMLNTAAANQQNSSADPFWEQSQRLLLTSLFEYVWTQCPTTVKVGNKDLFLGKDMKSVMTLLNLAQFPAKGNPPLDDLMTDLSKRDAENMSPQNYWEYRSGPDETVRSVLMTLNSRLQPLQSEKVLNIMSEDDIPFSEFGTGHEGDCKTKSDLFIVIPDDDPSFNFVPGMVYTLFFQELYRQARIFGGKLPMDVGFWFDEFANIKMPENFDKILATCRSRGVYCVPILQSLAQIKTLFKDGAWEGIIGNCDTFIYLGGNEQSTFKYINELLGKWTIDKRTEGETKGQSGSVSKNMDVLQRDLLTESEVRLLPDDECIVMLRGMDALHDKKWFPWEHKEYKDAVKVGKEAAQKREMLKNIDPTADFIGKKPEIEEGYEYLSKETFDFYKRQSETDRSISIVPIDVYDFLTMDLDSLAESLDDGEEVDPAVIKDFSLNLATERRKEGEKDYRERFSSMSLVEILTSEFTDDIRKSAIKDLISLRKKGAITDDEIKSCILPNLSNQEVADRENAMFTLFGG